MEVLSIIIVCSLMLLTPLPSGMSDIYMSFYDFVPHPNPFDTIVELMYVIQTALGII